ncbi:LytTR family DNA-binding domain-containing protein [Lentilactobacillus sp. Marseille-Q4993]|uniref:LytTR family DNA-binding domain-containing protein n=1 Tax=Lentilactobacillus sp. Marseille-Q4993 TaxID=3039492 RepID=UPI0024BCE0A9|nr:LytTR family DNA-binding domain-containing protein [Lentilactobacillus sp. Marseille-Q4993]
MKIRVEIDDSLVEKEIVIRAPEYDDNIKQLYDTVTNAVPKETNLVYYKDDSEFFLDLNDILFFETDNRQVHAHTATDNYTIKQRLYELEDILPSKFVRISKSAILNLDQIFSITRSVTGTVASFQKSQKQVFVSRRYYRPLKDRLEKRG